MICHDNEVHPQFKGYNFVLYGKLGYVNIFLLCIQDIS